MTTPLIKSLGDWPTWVTVRAHDPPSPYQIVLKGDEGKSAADIVALVGAKGLDIKQLSGKQIDNIALKRVVIILTFPEWMAKKLIASPLPTSKISKGAPPKSKAPVQVKAKKPEELNPFMVNTPDGWCSAYPRQTKDVEDKLQEDMIARFDAIELF